MISENLLLECGLYFISTLESNKVSSCYLSERTKDDLATYFDEGKKPVVSQDILVNCVNSGLDFRKSFSIAKRFSSCTFTDLADISDDKLLSCDGIGRVTVAALRRVLKPKEVKVVKSVRPLLVDTLLPTKVINTLNGCGIVYFDELRLLDSYEINKLHRNIADTFYKAYLSYGNVKPVDYVPSIMNDLVGVYIRGLNNFSRHGYRRESTTLNYIRYLTVAYLNELIFKLNISVGDSFTYFNGDCQSMVQKYNMVFNKVFGEREYEESKSLLNEILDVTSIIGKVIK